MPNQEKYAFWLKELNLQVLIIVSKYSQKIHPSQFEFADTYRLSYILRKHATPLTVRKSNQKNNDNSYYCNIIPPRITSAN